jgi:cytochrome c oxidase cbb3-type subunit 1
MTITTGALLVLSFPISVLGLFIFIWAQMNGLMRVGIDASEVIFAKAMARSA